MSQPKTATSYTSCSLHDPVKIRASKESVEELPVKTIPQVFHECCEKYKNLTAIAYQETPGENEAPWKTITYEEYEKNVKQTALALLYLGVEPRTSVGILAFNCPEWFYVQLAALSINAVSAGIYTTNIAESVYHVLETSDASVLVVEDSHQMSKVREIKSNLPFLKAVVQLKGPFEFDKSARRPGYYRWPDLMEMDFDATLREELKLRELQVAPNECAVLIFTSGTVGMPKGVMLSHDNILCAAHTVSKSFSNITPGHETIVSYLPLNHVAAQIFDINMSMRNGATVYFADRNALKGTLEKTFMAARPTMTIVVPRIYEKIQEKYMQLDDNRTGLVRLITNMARNTMLQYHLDKMEGKPTPLWKLYLASAIINRIKTSLGLERNKECLVGGAPASTEVKRFCLSLDLPWTDAYGMSECSGALVYSINRTNLQTVGKPLEGVEIEIHQPNEAGEGEILIRSRCNFMGYLKEPQKTSETLRADGSIFTGDIGYLDDQSNLYITGRIKELIITSGGENMPPVYIETLIKQELPCISNVLAVGDRRKYVTVLMTFKTHIDTSTGYPLDKLLPETIEWLATLDLYYTHLSDMLHIKLPQHLKDFDPNSVVVRLDCKIRKALADGIKRYNNRAISNAQKVQYFRILPHDFSIATGELGPTMKIRRNIVLSKYAKTIDTMYDN
ncbi:long-chain-fatty-acid--CoA ligase heimdall [Stomoxys calcitrans]|uniref:long-chain-fatty-acid--CoA ligase heimdall n=1 Tax=Stomoxys calcitrans TaxID=35570 RepID=UPI0027E3B161|nr:long-chain-fatty-acid--CoA ligase heimdall [Stomoxys calcitrans]